MSQTNYSNRMTQALSGLIADGFEPNIKTFAAGEDILFGYGVVEGANKGQVLLPSPGRTLVFDAVLVTGNLVDMLVNGSPITQVPFNTDNLTTLGDVAAAIQARPEVLSATVQGTDTILVKNQPAIDVFITGATVTGGASQANISVTGTNFYAFRGVAALDQGVQQDENGDALYKEKDAVNVLTQGTVWVPVEGSLVADDPVAFLSVVGDLSGRFEKATDSTHPSTVVNGAVFRSAPILVDGQNIAQVEFNLPVIV
jgi:hypothetical protein